MEWHFIKDYLENGTQQENANARVFTLTKADTESFTFKGECKIKRMPIISALKVARLLKEGWQVLSLK